MTDPTSGTTTKRKNKGDSTDKSRRYRSVGEIAKSTRCIPSSPPILGRHFDLDKTSRKWARDLGILYKRKRETGGRRSLPSIRVGPYPSPATGGSVCLQLPPRSPQIFGQMLLRMTTKNPIRRTRATMLNTVVTLRRKSQKSLRRSSGRGRSRGLVGGSSLWLYFIPRD